jgi:hypothetical protein
MIGSFFVVGPGVLARSTNWQLRYLLHEIPSGLVGSKSGFVSPSEYEPSGFDMTTDRVRQDSVR